MDSGELIVSILKISIYLLFFSSIFLIIKGIIKLIHKEGWRIFIRGIVLLTITAIIFFIVVLLGQIVGISNLPLKPIPKLD